MIIYMDIPLEDAYEKIIRTRKSSFFECGLDCFLWHDLEQAKKDYKNNVLRVYPKEDISEYVEYITSFLQK